MRQLINEILEKVPDKEDYFETKIILEYSDLAEVPAKLNGQSKYRYVVTPEKLLSILNFIGEDEDKCLVSLDDRVYSLQKLPGGGVSLEGSFPIKTI